MADRLVGRGGSRAVKNAAALGLAGLLLAASLWPAAAEAPPSYDILTTLRVMGLNPIGQPLRRGAYYVLHAYDARGVEMRVVADVELGDILTVAPVRPLLPYYERAPRIIHVQPASAPPVRERNTPPEKAR